MGKIATISPLLYSRHVELYEQLCGNFDHDYFAEKYGITQERLNTPDYRVPFSASTEFFILCADKLNDPCFGLTWAQKVRYSQSSAVVHKLALSPDVRSYFTQNIRLSKLTSEVAQFSIEPYHQGSSLFRMDVNKDVESSHHQIDATLLYTKRATQFFLQNRYPDTSAHSLDFIGVSIEHKCPENCEERYQKAFGIPVLFDQPKTGLILVDDWLDVRLEKGNPSISDIVSVEVAKAKMEGTQTLSEMVGYCIESLLPYGAPKRTHIAEALGYSLRTFQRTLKKEGISFKDVVDDMRKRLASSYLERNCYPIEEIAFLLGYSNISAFYVAYKRWYGKTPSRHYLNQLNTST